MQRSHRLGWHASHWLRGLALAIGLLGTQCLDSISDDCTKTLTCEDGQQPVLQDDCRWVYPGSGRPWEGAPRYDSATSTWRWPDGTPTESQNFDCNLNLIDAGTDAGPAGPDCRINVPCDAGQVCDDTSGNCVECVSDVECAGNMAMGDAGAATVCDTGSHRCVECLSNGNCGGDTRVCKTNPDNSQRNRCVECIGNGDCGGTTPICDDRTNECTSSCQSPADCSGDKPACNTARSICVECVDGSTCTTVNGKPLCETESNQCVECLDDGPCAATAAATGSGVCDLETHICVQCREDAQCLARPDAASLPFCDLEDRRCVQCLNDQQCTGGAASRCNVVSHECTGCTNDTQCESGVCNEMTGGCVECITTPDCAQIPGRSFCEGATGRCVECFESNQCPTTELPRCETSLTAGAASYTCVGCESEMDCGGRTNAELCNTTTGACVECLDQGSSADCLPRGPGLSRCQNGTCSICIDDADCGLYIDDDRPACKPAVGCVECTDNADCNDTMATPICKTADGDGPAPIDTCVECTTNEHCQTNASASRCVNDECAPCATDADCAGVDSNGTAVGGTPLNVCDAGTCVQCTGAKRAACGEDVCNSVAKTCAIGRAFRGAGTCDECVSDFECAANARCVQQTFAGQTVGFFCFPLATGMPAACTSANIFVGPIVSPTIDQEQPTPTVCQPARTTCEALADLAQATPCDNAADCGVPNLNDGICNGALDICTVPCNSGADCAGDCDLEAGACEVQ